MACSGGETAISRNDYASFVHMKADINALPQASRQMVEDVLAAMGEILEDLQGHYTGLGTLQEDVPHAPATSGNSCPTSETSRHGRRKHRVMKGSIRRSSRPRSGHGAERDRAEKWVVTQGS